MAIEPEVAQDFERVCALRRRDAVDVYAASLEPAPRDHQASRFVGGWPVAESGRGIEPFRLTGDGVGVITITGSLINRGSWIGSNSGETSYEGIKHQLSRAGADNRVKSVILDMETPGGQAVGAFEAAAAVRELSSKKPVIAVVNGMAASGGYVLAAGATKIITTPSGMLGSIGVVMLHLDHSEQLKAEGVSPTFIIAGARKVDGNPLEPLTDNAKQELQAEVNQFYDLFVDNVAAGRGRRTTAKAARDTEARTYVGKQAIDAKLADDVGTFEDVLHELGRKARRAGDSQSVGAKATRSQNMPQLNLDDDAQVAEAALENARQQGHAAGLTAGHTAGAEAERNRLSAVLNHPEAKGREQFALNLALEAPNMTADAVGRMCAQVPRAAATVERPSLAAREEETGANKVTSLPAGNTPHGGAPANPGIQGWITSTDNQNAITEANAPRAKHLLRK
jgi:signal peptide peptidase SppA